MLSKPLSPVTFSLNFSVVIMAAKMDKNRNKNKAKAKSSSSQPTPQYKKPVPHAVPVPDAFLELTTKNVTTSHRIRYASTQSAMDTTNQHSNALLNVHTSTSSPLEDDSSAEYMSGTDSSEDVSMFTDTPVTPQKISLPRKDLEKYAKYYHLDYNEQYDDEDMVDLVTDHFWKHFPTKNQFKSISKMENELFGNI
eukprot:298559_1